MKITEKPIIGIDVRQLWAVGQWRDDGSSPDGTFFKPDGTLSRSYYHMIAVFEEREDAVAFHERCGRGRAMLSVREITPDGTLSPIEKGNTATTK